MRSKVLGRSIAALGVAICAIAVSDPPASADGRAAEGAFCGPTCMALTWAGTTYGTNNRADLSLRPGIYWLTVRDAFTFHNYALRSCPDGASPCTSGDVRTITTIPGTPGEVTDELLLSQGTHRLFCALGSHEAQGMYVDFQVGGVGQLD